MHLFMQVGDVGGAGLKVCVCVCVCEGERPKGHVGYGVRVKGNRSAL